MSGAFSQVDASGNYLANIILKNGRNEVQTYPISHREGVLVDESGIKRHELQSDQVVSCVTWLNDTAELVPKKSTKRRADGDAATTTPTTTTPNTTTPNTTTTPTTTTTTAPSPVSVPSLLAVALENEEVWVFSPLRDEPVAVIHGAGKLVSLARGHTQNCFWGLSDAAVLVQMHAIDATVTRTVRFAKTDADVALVSAGAATAAAHRVLVASATLYVVDPARSRKNVVRQLAPAHPGDGCIAFAADVAPGVVAVARDLSGVLTVYRVAEEAAPRTLRCAGSNITRLAAVAPGTLVAFTEHGAEVFADAATAAPGAEPTACIRTSNAELPLENIVATAANGLVGVWYDGNQPRFVRIGDAAHVVGDVAVELQRRDDTRADATPARDAITFAAHEAAPIANVGAAELLARLSQMLGAAKVLRKEVVRLCAANDDEDNIKDAIRHFSQSERCADLVERLFEIVSKNVAADPSRKSSLSIWLKWILLAHGGYISKQEKLAPSLRLLQTSLDGGMNMMSKLLALQGRLQLLKSQAELRNKISGHVDDAADSEHDDETFNDTFNHTQNVEESVVYANGENDDDFVIENVDANGTLDDA